VLVENTKDANERQFRCDERTQLMLTSVPTGAMLRAARVLVGETIPQTALRSNTAVGTVHRVESLRDTQPPNIRLETLASLIAHFENQGIRFIATESHRGVMLVHDRGGDL
jgi:hypothetical protein